MEHNVAKHIAYSKKLIHKHRGIDLSAADIIQLVNRERLIESIGDAYYLGLSCGIQYEKKKKRIVKD